jgi:hypothetical protein
MPFPGQIPFDANRPPLASLPLPNQPQHVMLTNAQVIISSNEQNGQPANYPNVVHPNSNGVEQQQHSTPHSPPSEEKPSVTFQQTEDEHEENSKNSLVNE